MTTPLRRLQNAKAQEDRRRREKAAGLIRMNVTIPADRADELRRLVRQWTDTNVNVEGLDAGHQ